MSKCVKTPPTVDSNTDYGDFPGSKGILNALGRGRGNKFGIFKRLEREDITLPGTLPVEKDQFYYHTDHLGSSNMITDIAGSVYQHLEYFPYGETWIEEGGTYNGNTPPYKFTGKELDPETGLYYFGARYYDPVLSKWISADPAFEFFLPNDMNRDMLTQRITIEEKIRAKEEKRLKDYSELIKPRLSRLRSNRKEVIKDRLFKPFFKEADKEKIYEKQKEDAKIYEPLCISLYSYTKNNPVVYIDPDGNLEIDIITPTKLTEEVKKLPDFGVIKKEIEKIAAVADKVLHFKTLPEVPGKLLIKPKIKPEDGFIDLIKDFDLHKIEYSIYFKYTVTFEEIENIFK